MMDPRPIYPDMFHPLHQNKGRSFDGYANHSRRSKHPVKYYYIDFGLSHKFDADDNEPLVWPVLGGDRTVPELGSLETFNPTKPLNPFPIDIYYLGHLIQFVFFRVSAIGLLH